MYWHIEFMKNFVDAMDNKVPVSAALYVKVASALCVVNYKYSAAAAKDPETFAPSIDQLERIMGTYDHGALVKDLIAAVRQAAPEEDVFALTRSTTQTILASLEKEPR